MKFNLLASILLFLFVGIDVSGQAQNALSQKKQNDQYKELLDALEGLEPEYAARILFDIDLSDKQLIPPVQFRKSLLHLFNAAERTHYESNMIYAASHESDGRVARTTQNISSMYGDRVDIESHIVRILTKYDLDLAVAEFVSIRLPEKTATCEDAGVEDYTEYYDTFRELYSNKKIQKFDGQSKAIYLIDLIQRANTIERLVPLIQILPKLELKADELQEVQSLLTEKFNSLRVSDRAMRALSGKLESSVSEFMSKLSVDQIPTQMIRKALETLFLNNLHENACSDVSTDRRDILTSFNTKFADKDNVSPLLLADLLPLHTKGEAREELVPQFDELHDLLWSIHSDTHSKINPSSNAQKSTTLNDDVQKIVNTLHDSRFETDCTSCIFAGRARIYLILIQLLPKGSQLEYAIEEYFSMIEHSQVEHDDPAIYGGYLKTLMTWQRPTSQEAQKKLSEYESKGFDTTGWKQTDDKQYLRRRIAQTSDPVIHAFALYEELYKPEYKLE